MNRDFLQKQLTTVKETTDVAFQSKKVDVKIIDFGFHDGKGQYEEHNFNEANVAGIMKVKPVTNWKKHIRWIDIHGDSPEVVQLLANENDVPPFIIDETYLKLSGKVQFFPEHKILEVVTYRVALEHLPLRQLTNVKKKPKSHNDDDEEEREITKGLISGNKYLSPEIRYGQIMFFCFGENTVLTVRRRSHLQPIAHVFAEIPGDIRNFTSEIRSHMEITSTREFLCSLLNEVNEQNWRLRDDFKEWKIVLEHEMHTKLESGQSRHLLDLDRTANSAIKYLEPYTTSAIKAFNLEEAEDVAEEGKKEKDIKDKSKTESDTKAIAFVLKEKALFRDTTLSAQRLVASLTFTRDTCAQLNEFYRHQSEEQQNNTLKLLTVITSTVLPMQISTGVFGMNFEYMPELPYEWSYLIFWLLNVFFYLPYFKFLEISWLYLSEISVVLRCKPPFFLQCHF